MYIYVVAFLFKGALNLEFSAEYTDEEVDQVEVEHETGFQHQTANCNVYVLENCSESTSEDYSEINRQDHLSSEAWIPLDSTELSVRELSLISNDDLDSVMYVDLDQSFEVEITHIETGEVVYHQLQSSHGPVWTASQTAEAINCETAIAEKTFFGKGDLHVFDEIEKVVKNEDFFSKNEEVDQGEQVVKKIEPALDTIEIDAVYDASFEDAQALPTPAQKYVKTTADNTDTRRDVMSPKVNLNDKRFS
jgi:hypothetical protein